MPAFLAIMALLLTKQQDCRSDGACRLVKPQAGTSAQNPCFSPDGSQLIYTVWKGGYNIAPAGMYRVSTNEPALRSIDSARLVDDGSSSVNLPGSCWSRNGISVSSIEPSFSPTADRIVYERSISDSSAEIWIVNLSDGSVKQLTTGFQDRQPNWSPVEDLILFQRMTKSGFRLCTIRADGSDLTIITPDSIAATDAVFSPNGKSIAFSMERADIAGASIAIIPTIGAKSSSDIRRITTAVGYDGAVSFSPDGNFLAFETSTDVKATKPTSIYVIALNSTNNALSPTATKSGAVAGFTCGIALLLVTLLI
ncbi:hypothetical protein BDR26DRAFT_851066 [Obelidium mucronatum]|nr:hypothetical protein BDR26DRAFT_851066 [Obelidium mucronatum]